MNSVISYMKRPLFLLILLIVFACDMIKPDGNSDTNDTGDVTENYGDFKLNDDAIFMTEETTSLFSSVEDGKIIIPASVSQESIPSVGTIIVAPITTMTPLGLLVKVISLEKTASEYILSTEPALLTDAFEELRIESTLNATPYIEHATDKDGNVILPEEVSSNIWEEFAKSPEDTTFTIPTKAAGSIETTLSNKFPLNNDIFKGHIFANFILGISIDISKAKLNNFEINITKQTGISGDLMVVGIEDELEWEIADIKYKFKAFLIPNTPIVVKPSLYVEETLKAESKIEVKAAMRYYVENQLYQFSFNGSQAKAKSERLKDDSYIKFKAISAETEIELSTTAGGKFAIYDDALLAFGLELTASETFKMANEISTNNKNLLVDNPEVEVTPALTASLYCESNLFELVPNAEQGRFSYDWNFGLSSYKLTTLPQFSGIQKNEAGGKLIITADVDKKCFLECSDEGFAIFDNDEEEPITHLSFKAQTKAITSNEVAFDLPSSEKSYVAIPYVVADNKYYYDKDGRWVDLGLPSGILWAKYNVGATSPEEYGDYYAWGEVTPKQKYSAANYLYYTKENGEYSGSFIGNDISGTEYDAAHVNWGNGARMPNKSEAEELVKYCNWKHHTYNGVGGGLITGPNNNSIVLPFAGGFYNNQLWQDPLNSALFWTSQPYNYANNTDASLCGCAIDDGWQYKVGADAKFLGISIRAVKNQ